MNSKILNAVGLQSLDPMIIILVLALFCIILFPHRNVKFKVKKDRSSLRSERVEKVDTLLDGNAARSKIKDFRTALYPRQYHPSVLEKPLYSAVFRLQGAFPPRMSAENQNMQHNRRKSRL